MSASSSMTWQFDALRIQYVVKYWWAWGFSRWGVRSLPVARIRPCVPSYVCVVDFLSLVLMGRDDFAHTSPTLRPHFLPTRDQKLFPSRHPSIRSRHPSIRSRHPSIRTCHQIVVTGSVWLGFQKYFEKIYLRKYLIQKVESTS